MPEHQQKINSIIDNIILDDNVDTELSEKDVVARYKELSDKCDVVISKIKKRKAKKKTT